MNYTRGRAGPVSRMRLEIRDAIHVGEGAQALARGDGIATMARGKVKGVSFLVQGKHLAALGGRLASGREIDVSVRWTGGSAVTIVETHESALQPQAIAA